MREKRNDISAVSRISKRIENQRTRLVDEFGVSSLGLFGSYLSGDESDDSDLDLLIEYQRTPTLLEFVRLQRYLSELLGVQVDLVMKSALKPKIGQRILEEAVPLWQSDSKRTTSTI